MKRMWSEEELQNVPQMISEKMAAQQQLIEVLMNQVIEQDVYEISKVAIKIVEYFNPPSDEVWDSKMYEQKHVVIDLLNQLNQNKDE